jgi:hypothetical protein
LSVKGLSATIVGLRKNLMAPAYNMVVLGVEESFDRMRLSE